MEYALAEIIKKVPPSRVQGKVDGRVCAVTADSREVTPGTLFVARQGQVADGFDFIPQAVSKGAAAIATERYHPDFSHVPQLIYESIDKVQCLLAQVIYPELPDFLVGVTGTNGKTTTAYLVQHLLPSCGLIGTIESKWKEVSIPATLTTPDLFTTYRTLSQMQKEGCEACVMEVSSHALCQGRVEGLNFDVGIFTNLTQEHLDYHGTMQEYAEAKAKLFEMARVGVINADSSYFKQMCHGDVLSYGISSECKLFASNLSLGSSSSAFDVNYRSESVHIETNLIGSYNVSNLLAAMGTSLVRGLSLQEIQERLKEPVLVPGRLERIASASGPEVVIDFAHTQDALESVMENLNRIKRGRLFVVFGCGGNRDALKRPHMGAAVERLADVAIVTSDNPRDEEPLSIIQEILKGMQEPSKAIAIADRKEAVAHAIAMAGPFDLVLVAGRGHERVQTVRGERVPCDDREIARDALKRLGF